MLDEVQKLFVVSRQLKPGQHRGNIRDILLPFKLGQSPLLVHYPSFKCKRQLEIRF